MQQICYYDPAVRQLEKERQRISDFQQLSRREISPSALRVQNGYIGKLKIVGSSIRRKKVFA